MSAREIVEYAALKPFDIGLIGICSDHNSSYMRGPAEAPPKIREALFCGAANLTSELGCAIGQTSRFKDLGDRLIADNQQAYLEIRQLILPILEKDAIPFHSVLVVTTLSLIRYFRRSTKNMVRLIFYILMHI